MSSVIEQVEAFIRRLHDMDYILSPEVSGLIYVNESNQKDGRLFSDHLAKSIFEYEKYKNDDQVNMKYGRVCLLWINRAFAHGIVREGQGLAKKLETCMEENAQLLTDLEILSEQYRQLKAKYEPLKGYFESADENDLEKSR